MQPPQSGDFKRGAQERGGVTSNETARPLVSLKRTKPTSVKVAPADSKPTSGEKPTVSPQRGQRAQGADQNFQMTNLHDSDDSMTDCRQQQALSTRFVPSPDEKEQSNKKASPFLCLRVLLFVISLLLWCAVSLSSTVYFYLFNAEPYILTGFSEED